MESLCRRDHVLTDLCARPLACFALMLAANAAIAQADPLGINPDSDSYGRYASMASVNGNTLIAYENRQGARGMTVTICEGPACRFPISQVQDPQGTSNGAGVFASLLIPSDGLPVIVHVKFGAGGGIRVAKCGSSVCLPVMGAPPTTLVNVGSTGFFPNSVSAAVSSDGFPVISASLADGSVGQGLWVLKCSDPFCMGAVTETQIDPSRPNSGRWNATAIGADGMPVIAYQDRTSTGSNGNVMLLKCNDPACLGGDDSFSELEPLSGSVDRQIDLAIGPGGNPVIAFATPTGGLGLIACNDAACLGDDESFNVVSTRAAIGSAVALALNTLGHPVLAAHGFNSAANSLEVIACNDPLCSGNDEQTLHYFDDIDPDIGFGRYADLSHAGNDVFSLVYMREERISTSQFDRSLRVVDCTIEGCGVVFQDGYEDASGAP